MIVPTTSQLLVILVTGVESLRTDSVNDSGKLLPWKDWRSRQGRN